MTKEFEEFKARVQSRRKMAHTADAIDPDTQSEGARLRARVARRMAERKAERERTQPGRDRLVIRRASRWRILRPAIVSGLVASLLGAMGLPSCTRRGAGYCCRSSFWRA
jgi:hypothetical protein